MLRETVDGRSAWDVAFEKLESQKKRLTSDIVGVPVIGTVHYGRYALI